MNDLVIIGAGGHGKVIADHAHISIDSHLAGTVNIGTCTWIRAGAIVNNNVIICGSCVIGAGTVEK